MAEKDTQTPKNSRQARVDLKADAILDASRVVFPFGLILGKATLDRLAPGQILELLIMGRETCNNLLIILARSGDQVLAREAQREGIRLWVQKGSGHFR